MKTPDSSFGSYHDYMSNEEKTSGLFSTFSDELNRHELSFYKKKFNQAQEQGGILWQHVISYDNEWLKENKILTDEMVDDKKLKQATKEAMTELLKREKMLGNSYWTAAIHYNTDNIHVHVAMVEKKVMRERGKLKQSSMDHAKSKVISTLLDRRDAQQKITELTRNSILNVAKKETYHQEFETEFKELATNLTQFQYGRLTIEDKNKVDHLSRKVLVFKFPQTYCELQEQLEKESQVYMRAYGEGERHLYQTYRDNREQDLQRRLGNVILKQVKSYNEELRRQEYQAIREAKHKKFNQRLNLKEKDYQLKKLQRELENETQKAISEYEAMVKGAEYER